MGDKQKRDLRKDWIVRAILRAESFEDLRQSAANIVANSTWPADFLTEARWLVWAEKRLEFHRAAEDLAAFAREDLSPDTAAGRPPSAGAEAGGPGGIVGGNETPQGDRPASSRHGAGAEGAAALKRSAWAAPCCAGDGCPECSGLGLGPEDETRTARKA